MSLLGGPSDTRISDIRKVSAPTQRETPPINHSWSYGTSQASVINRDFVEVMNHQTGSVDLYMIEGFGNRTLISSKNSGDANWTWKAGENVLNPASRQALAAELNPGSSFNKKLDDKLINTAAQDFKGGKKDAIEIYGKSISVTENVEDKASGGADPPPGNSGGSSFSVTKEQEKTWLDKISQGVEARSKYEQNLKYPEQYDGNDYLTIEMIRYIPNKNLGLGGITGDENSGSVLNSGLKLQTFSERANDSKEGPIVTFTLPIPSNLIDANPVNWTDDPLDPLKAYGAGAIGRLLGGENIFKSAESEVKRAAGALKANADAGKTILNASIINQILGANTLTRATGAVVNQNTELLFKGVALRSFVFNFKMTPRSKKEADIVRKIIRGLKQGMSAKRTVDGIFLASPNVFKLQFWYVPPKPDGETIKGNTPQEHPYLPKFKPCALTNISVNYMPDGSYMTYGDGSMISYDMTLAFSEIDPIFDDDYYQLDNDTDKFIGY